MSPARRVDTRRGASPPVQREESLREWLAAGPYTLALSSGFCCLHHHAGVLAALEDAGVPPYAVSGSSAGAGIAALHAAGLSPEQMLELCTGDPPDVVRLARPWREPGGLLSSRWLVHVIDEIIARYSLAETLECCVRPVSISTFVARRLRTWVLSSSDGYRNPPCRLSEAIVASLAVPPLFAPLCLDGIGLCTDGGIGDFPGMRGIDGRARVLYHHASFLPLSLIERGYMGGDHRHSPHRRTLKIGGLPVLNPLTLGRIGPTAYAAAREAAERALERPASADGAGSTTSGAPGGPHVVCVRARTWPLGVGMSGVMPRLFMALLVLLASLILWRGVR